MSRAGPARAVIAVLLFPVIARAEDASDAAESCAHAKAAALLAREAEEVVQRDDGGRDFGSATDVLHHLLDIELDLGGHCVGGVAASWLRIDDARVEVTLNRPRAELRQALRKPKDAA